MPTAYGHREVLVRGYVHETVVGLDLDRSIRSTVTAASRLNGASVKNNLADQH